MPFLEVFEDRGPDHDRPVRVDEHGNLARGVQFQQVLGPLPRLLEGEFELEPLLRERQAYGP